MGAIGAPGVVRVEVFDCKARAGEQVLDFEAEEVSQSEGVDKPFLAAVGVSDIVDQLMGAGLLEAILGDRIPGGRRRRDVGGWPRGTRAGRQP